MNFPIKANQDSKWIPQPSSGCDTQVQQSLCIAPLVIDTHFTFSVRSENWFVHFSSWQNQFSRSESVNTLYVTGVHVNLTG